MENFNLRKFLYNNTLLTENQEMEEVSSKLKKSELKEKIRAEIMSTLSEEDKMDEAAKPCTPENRASEAEVIADDLELSGDAKEKFKKELLSKTSTCKNWDQFYDIADKIGSKLTEDEGDDELDAALDAADDEVGDEAPADDAPADGGLEDEPAGPELSDEAGLSDEETDIQQNLKKAYDNAVSIGDEKLANQIANTITFFTRAHVVPRND